MKGIIMAATRYQTAHWQQIKDCSLRTLQPGFDRYLRRLASPSQIAFSQVMPDEKKDSAVAFLKVAVDYYRRLGVVLERVMTDNGSCYKSFAFRHACK